MTSLPRGRNHSGPRQQHRYNLFLLPSTLNGTTLLPKPRVLFPASAPHFCSFSVTSSYVSLINWFKSPMCPLLPALGSSPPPSPQPTLRSGRFPRWQYLCLSWNLFFKSQEDRRQEKVKEKKKKKKGFEVFERGQIVVIVM